MTTIDFVILGILVASMVIGFFRGFFPEVVGVATWVVAGIGAMHFGDAVQPYLEGKMGSPTVEMWTARAALFVFLMVIGGLVGQLVSLAVDKAGLSGTDKTLGMAFGAVRGIIVLGVLVIFAQLIGFPRDAWWSESRLIPVGETVADAIRTFLPDRVADFVQPSAQDAEAVPPDPNDLAQDAIEALTDAASAVGGDSP